MKTKLGSDYIETTLGLLPQSHIYSLVLVCHCAGYRGDRVINLPKFEINSYLRAIQRFRIGSLMLVGNHHNYRNLLVQLSHKVKIGH